MCQGNENKVFAAETTIVDGEYYYIKNCKSELYLSENYGSDVCQYKKENSSHFLWKAVKQDETFYFVSGYSGNALTIENSSTADWAKIVLTPLSYGDEQKFSLSAVTDESYNIISSLSEKAIDIYSGYTYEGNYIIQYTLGISTNMQWEFEAGNVENVDEEDLGDGSEDNPYVIKTMGQLVSVAGSSDSFILANDIDASAYKDGVITAIGTSSNPFKGILDGAGHKIYNISNIKGDKSRYTRVGLFGTTENATIKNLGVELKDGCVITSNDYQEGAAAGMIVGSGSGTISKCYVKGDVLFSKSGGAFTGYYGMENVGLIAGGFSGNIEECYAEGNAKSGLGFLTNCTTSCGGIVGHASGTITNCMVKGDITGYASGGASHQAYAGGINGAGGAICTNCIFIGTVNSNSSNLINPIKGAGDSISNCYFEINSGLFIESKKYEGCTGLSSTDMKKKESFENFDFNIIWKYDEGQYPYLKNVSYIPNSTSITYELDSFSSSNSEKKEIDSSIDVSLNTSKADALKELPKEGYAIFSSVNDDQFIPVLFSWECFDYDSSTKGTYHPSAEISYKNQGDQAIYGEITICLNGILNVGQESNEPGEGDNPGERDEKILIMLEDIEKSDPKCKHNGDYWGSENNEFEGASQCLGFVKYITYKLFGEENIFGHNFDLLGSASCSNTSELASLFMDARAGDVLLLNNSSNKDDGFNHFAVYMSSDDDGIYVYEGNRSGFNAYNQPYKWGEFNQFWSEYVHLLRCSSVPAETVGVGDLKGWTQIEEACSNNSESSFYVNMNDETSIPDSLFQIAKDKQVNLNLNYGTYSWSINSESINTAKSLDLKVEFGNSFIPETLVSPLMNPFQQLNLVYSGDLGLTASLRYYIGKTYSGKKVTLYYYDEAGKVLRKEKTSIVDSNGYVSFDFSHASSYVMDMEGTTEPVILEELSSEVDSSDSYYSSTEINMDKSEETLFFDAIVKSIDVAAANNQKIIKVDGKTKGINSLSYAILKYAKEKCVSLDFIYTYKGIDYEVIIPSEAIYLDNKIPWYGPLYLYSKYNSLNKESIDAIGVDSGEYYYVKKGDTLSEIAKKYRMSLKRLKELNPAVFKQKYLRIGQKIAIS